jgi:hypothetical protein|tara:strand:+ start:695 stop:1582 length:888 start_codon:yes stop_codon:yes gene_type:complete
MKILYIGVHSHTGWGAEYWLAKAFQDLQIHLETIDYRSIRKNEGTDSLKRKIQEKSRECQLIFLQRGEHLSPTIFEGCNIPIIFWSTEPLQLKTDVDKLLNSDIFSWVFLHSYSCVERVKSEFSHIIIKSNVIHNAAPKDILEFGTEKVKSTIFNRNLSWRRKLWLWPSGNMIDKISGRYGEDYFTDLREANIAVNIHYSRQNLDDFESGIFEAMASGCAVISESLNHQTLVDLGMEDAILQVNSPFELKEKIRLLNKDEKLLKSFQTKSQQVIQKNTWHDRAQQIKEKFKEFYN